MSAGAVSAPALTAFNLPPSQGGLTEAAIAVDPRSPSRLAVLATDYAGSVVTAPAIGEQTRVAPTCRLFESSSQGRSWSSTDFAGSHAPSVPYLTSSNASVAIGRSGALFAACLANNGSAGGAVVFARGDVTRGITSSSLLSTPGAGAALTADKPWVAASNDGRSVAVVWAEFLTNPGAAVIVTRVSRDGGLTFGPIHLVSGPTITASGEEVASSGLPTALFLPSGRLLIAWHASLLDGAAGDVIAYTWDGEALTPPTSVAMRNVAQSGVRGRYPRHANQPSLALVGGGSQVEIAAGIQTTQGVRAAIATVSGNVIGATQTVTAANADTDQLNAAVAVAITGTTGVVFQQVTHNELTTRLARRVNGRWSVITLSSGPTHVVPYSSTNNGTSIGDFLMLVRLGQGLLTVFPEEEGGHLELRGVIIR